HNDEAPPADADLGPDESRIVASEQFLRFCFENAYNAVPTPTAVVRTRLQQEVGGYSPEFPHSGDLEMWMRFAVRGAIGACRSVQAFYRWHQRNMGAQYYARMLGDRREFMQTCERMLVRCAETFPDTPRWREALDRTVGASALRSASKSLELGDAKACEAWLEFAEQTDPTIRGSVDWWRFQIKRRIG